jgi:hypothetical protein
MTSLAAQHGAVAACAAAPLRLRAGSVRGAALAAFRSSEVGSPSLVCGCGPGARREDGAARALPVRPPKLPLERVDTRLVIRGSQPNEDLLELGRSRASLSTVHERLRIGAKTHWPAPRPSVGKLADPIVKGEPTGERPIVYLVDLIRSLDHQPSKRTDPNSPLNAPRLESARRPRTPSQLEPVADSEHPQAKRT